MTANDTRRSADSGDQRRVPDADVHDLDAWAFYWEHLVDVSRTFSQPIEMLEGELSRATTCGYQHCRVADSIEDHPG